MQNVVLALLGESINFLWLPATEVYCLSKEVLVVTMGEGNILQKRTISHGLNPCNFHLY